MEAAGLRRRTVSKKLYCASAVGHILYHSQREENAPLPEPIVVVCHTTILVRLTYRCVVCHTTIPVRLLVFTKLGCTQTYYCVELSVRGVVLSGVFEECTKGDPAGQHLRNPIN